VSIASLDPEIARRTITLFAPSKTFNIAGLEASVAVIEDEDLRKQFLAARSGLVSWVNLLGQVATLAAYRDAGDWLAAALRYLEQNRNYLAAEVASRLPGVHMAVPEGTYLAWLDCREAGLDGNPHEFFLKHAKVAMNDGATFGRGGEGFVRLNFGCPRSTLEEALARLEGALAGR
jgi:cystathionine beta-lyase